MAFKQEPKDRTINIRASSQQLTLIDQAAALSDRTRSDFMLDAAVRAAEDALVESSVFTLPADAWEAYLASIASPPAPTAALRTLLKEPAPWDWPRSGSPDPYALPTTTISTV